MKLSPANPPHISQFSRLLIINDVLYPGAYSIRKTKCKKCHILVENRHVFKLRIHFLLWMYTIWWHNLASVYTVQLQFRGMDENTEWCIQWAVQYLRDFCETQKKGNIWFDHFFQWWNHSGSISHFLKNLLSPARDSICTILLISLLVCLHPYLMSPSLPLWSPPPLKNLSLSLCPRTVNPLAWMTIVQLPLHRQSWRFLRDF